MLSEWPLVGRLEELAFIEQAMARPETAGVIVAGAAGVGKTRLVSEALERARARKFPTAWATATYSAGRIAFGALAHLLPPELAAEGGRENLLRVAVDALVGEDEGKPLVRG